jgi:hypothetical protein
MQNDPDKAAERLATVIRATNIIESKMKRAIIAYLKVPPEREIFAVSQLLNNAVTPFGAKLKLILTISRDLSSPLDREALHTMLSRRNAFAHQDHLQSIKIVQTAGEFPEVTCVVESLRGSGELEVVTQEQAFAEFFQAYLAAEKGLDMLLKALRVSE